MSDHYTFTFPNGAIGHREGIMQGSILPFTKISNCPIKGTDIRLTCRSAKHESYYRISAYTKYKGKRIKGYLIKEGRNVLFNPLPEYYDILGIE